MLPGLNFSLRPCPVSCPDGLKLLLHADLAKTMAQRSGSLKSLLHAGFDVMDNGLMLQQLETPAA